MAAVSAGATAALRTAAPAATLATAPRAAVLLAVPLKSSSASVSTVSVALHVQVSGTDSVTALTAALTSSAVSNALPAGAVVSVDSVASSSRTLPTGYRGISSGADIAPPQLRLLGDADVTLNVFSEYQDVGATCVDGLEGGIGDVAAAGLPINVAQATPAGVPTLVAYGCADAAGNVAAVVARRVTVYDPCQAQSEATCANTRACSVAGSCNVTIKGTIAASATASSTVQSRRSAAVVDRTAPVITVLDPANPARPGQDYSIGGSSKPVGRVTYILAGSTFRDPGARAWDATDSNVTASIARALPPSGALDTRIPRGEDDPYLITYIASDAAGNRAVAFRRVAVVCADGERVCDASETADGNSACSSGGGICGVQDTGFGSSSSSDSTGSSTTASSSGTSSSSTGSSSQTTGANTSPVVTLVGNALVALVADPDATYAPCTPRSALTELCDAWVTATDAEDGNMLPLVRACGGSPGAVSLSACGIDTSVAGDYPVNFTVTDTSGAHSWAARTVRVCPSDEIVCDDLSCSQDGLCTGVSVDQSTSGQAASGDGSSPGDNGGSSGSGATGASASGSTASAASTSATSLAATATIADGPTLQLLESTVVRGSVQLPRGQTYKLCAINQAATQRAPCDPGLVAVNRLGINITDQVYVCPPDQCVNNAVDCVGHEYWKKGIEGCIDSTTDVGITQSVSFVVFDRWAKQPRATAVREITMVNPCASTEEYCDDGTCSLVKCATRDALRGAAQVEAEAAAGPLLLFVDGGNGSGAAALGAGLPQTVNTSLLAALAGSSSSGPLYGSSRTITLPYGKAAPYSLLPCGGVRSLGGCGALALDASDGDLSTSITVLPTCFSSSTASDSATDDGSSDSSTTECAHCDAASLTSGICAPGLYALRYSVSDANDNTASLILQVLVEERAVLSLAFNFTAQLPPLAAPPPSPPASPPAPEGADTGSQQDSSGASAAAARALAAEAGAAFEAQMRSNTSLQTSLATAYLPDLGVNLTTVRQFNVTLVQLLWTNATLSDAGSDTYAGMSAVLTVSLEVTVGLPPPTGSQSGSTASRRRRALEERRSCGRALEGPSTLRKLPELPEPSSGDCPLDSAPSKRPMQLRIPFLPRSPAHVDASWHAQPAPSAPPPAIEPPPRPPPGGTIAPQPVAAIRDSLAAAAAGVDARLAQHVQQMATLRNALARDAPHGTARARARMLQDSTCGSAAAGLATNATAVAAATSASGGTFGAVTGLSAPSVACATAAVDPTSALLASLAGATGALLDLGAQITAAMTAAGDTVSGLGDKFDARDNILTDAYDGLQAVADAAIANATARANAVLQLLDRTLAAQSTLSAAVDAAALLLTVALREAQEAAVRAVLTADIILDGLGDVGPEPGTDEWTRLSECLNARGILRGFTIAFGVGAEATAAVAATIPPPAPPSPEPPSPPLAARRSTLASVAAAAEGAARHLLRRLLAAVPLLQRRRALAEDDAAVADTATTTNSSNATMGNTTANASTSVASVPGYDFAGYNLFGVPLQRLEYSLADVSGRSTPTRVLGHSGSVILGGLLLHQTRLDADSLAGEYSTCDGGSRFGSSLAAACVPGYGKTIGPPSSPRGRLSGIGTDPVFNSRSQLYRRHLASRPGDFYNATDGSGELNANGMPYGFFPSPIYLPGLSDEPGRPGYPVLLDQAMSQKRSQQALLALSEGAYLDPTLTKRLSAQLVTYSADLRVFGFWKATFEWIASGSISVSLIVQGLPAVSWRASVQSGRTRDFLPDLFIAILAALYCSFTIYDVYSSIMEQRARAKAVRRLAKMAARGVSVTNQGAAGGGFDQKRGRSFLARPSSAAMQRSFLAVRSNRVASYTQQQQQDAAAARMYHLDSGTAPWLLHPDEDNGVHGVAIGEGTELHLSSTDAAAAAAGGSSAGHSGDGSYGDASLLSAAHMAPQEAHKRRPSSLRATSARGRRSSVESVGWADAERPWSPSSVAEDDDSPGDKEQAGKAQQQQQQLPFGEDGEEEVIVHGKKVRKYRPRMTLFWAAFECGLCGLMAACLALLYIYSLHVANTAPQSGNFDVYDAIESAPARFFQLRRRSADVAAESGGAANSTAAAAGALPGDAGRWTLPEDTSGLAAMANMYYQVERMYTTWVLYGFLQSVVLVLLITRLVHHLSFQPRLSIISGTLARMIPDLANFVLVVVLVLVMFAAMLIVLWGPEVNEFSSMSNAVVWALSFFVNGAGSADATGIINDVTSPAKQPNGAYLFMAWMVNIASPLFFVFVVANFVMAILAWPFSELKMANADEPLASTQIVQITRWYLQRLFKRAPKNKAILRLSERVLSRPPRGGGQWARIRQSFAASFATADAFRRGLAASLVAAARPEAAYKTMILEAQGQRFTAPQVEAMLRQVREVRDAAGSAGSGRGWTSGRGPGSGSLRAAAATAPPRPWWSRWRRLGRKDEQAPSAPSDGRGSGGDGNLRRRLGVTSAVPFAAAGSGRHVLSPAVSTRGVGLGLRPSEEGEEGGEEGAGGGESGRMSTAAALEHIVAAQLVRRLGELQWHKDEAPAAGRVAHGASARTRAPPAGAASGGVQGGVQGGLLAAVLALRQQSQAVPAAAKPAAGSAMEDADDLIPSSEAAVRVSGLAGALVVRSRASSVTARAPHAEGASVAEVLAAAAAAAGRSFSRPKSARPRAPLSGVEERPADAADAAAADAGGDSSRGGDAGAAGEEVGAPSAAIAPPGALEEPVPPSPAAGAAGASEATSPTSPEGAAGSHVHGHGRPVLPPLPPALAASVARMRKTRLSYVTFGEDMYVGLPPPPADFQNRPASASRHGMRKQLSADISPTSTGPQAGSASYNSAVGLARDRPASPPGSGHWAAAPGRRPAPLMVPTSPRGGVLSPPPHDDRPASASVALAGPRPWSNSPSYNSSLGARARLAGASTAPRPQSARPLRAPPGRTASAPTHTALLSRLAPELVNRLQGLLTQLEDGTGGRHARADGGNSSGGEGADAAAAERDVSFWPAAPLGFTTVTNPVYGTTSKADVPGTTDTAASGGEPAEAQDGSGSSGPDSPRARAALQRRGSSASGVPPPAAGAAVPSDAASTGPDDSAGSHSRYGSGPDSADTAGGPTAPASTPRGLRLAPVGGAAGRVLPTLPPLLETPSPRGGVGSAATAGGSGRYGGGTDSGSGPMDFSVAAGAGAPREPAEAAEAAVVPLMMAVVRALVRQAEALRTAFVAQQDEQLRLMATLHSILASPRGRQLLARAAGAAATAAAAAPSSAAPEISPTAAAGSTYPFAAAAAEAGAALDAAENAAGDVRGALAALAHGVPSSGAAPAAAAPPAVRPPLQFTLGAGGIEPMSPPHVVVARQGARSLTKMPAMRSRGWGARRRVAAKHASTMHGRVAWSSSGNDPGSRGNSSGQVVLGRSRLLSGGGGAVGQTPVTGMEAPSGTIVPSVPLTPPSQQVMPLPHEWLPKSPPLSLGAPGASPTLGGSASQSPLGVLPQSPVLPWAPSPSTSAAQALGAFAEVPGAGRESRTPSGRLRAPPSLGQLQLQGDLDAYASAPPAGDAAAILPSVAPEEALASLYPPARRRAPAREPETPPSGPMPLPPPPPIGAFPTPSAVAAAAAAAAATSSARATTAAEAAAPEAAEDALLDLYPPARRRATALPPLWQHPPPLPMPPTRPALAPVQPGGQQPAADQHDCAMPPPPLVPAPLALLLAQAQQLPVPQPPPEAEAVEAGQGSNAQRRESAGADMQALAPPASPSTAQKPAAPAPADPRVADSRASFSDAHEPAAQSDGAGQAAVSVEEALSLPAPKRRARPT